MGEVFEGARALPADMRPRVLREKCGGDEALRQEVESLLAWGRRAESLLETPVQVRVDDSIVIRNIEGQRIGPYQLASKIGAGGMGEVYKARDTRLDRTVAIKVLPRTSPRIRMPASASIARPAPSPRDHPHICTLLRRREPAVERLGQALTFS